MTSPASASCGCGGRGTDAAGNALNAGEDIRLVEALRSGVAPDFDVYDAAAWSSIAVLSEKSVADRSRPVDFPDFTRGKWKTTPPIKIMGV